MKLHKIARIFKVSTFIAVTLLCLMIAGCKKEPVENPTNGRTTAVFYPNVGYGTMTDQDGNIYKTIKIGDQIWMAENLRTTKFRNGELIPEVTESADWKISTTASRCNYKNSLNDENIATFGRLYNWYAISDSRQLTPAGWHVPSDAEWTTLVAYLGEALNVGGKLKEAGTTHWKSPNELGTNTTGFTGLPAGFRSILGYDYNLGYFGYWWSSTDISTNEACYRALTYDFPLVYGNWADFKNKLEGLSIRCIKD